MLMLIGNHERGGKFNFEEKLEWKQNLKKKC